MSKPAANTFTERPPVVSVMGHIDHGKSTLLDYIRKTNIVAGEAGGITQKLSAYEAVHTTAEGKEKKITFIDTPGHEAFAAMRSRGAKVADVGILVVSAEDGVKQQTLEAYSCIQSSKIPIVVAITKIDKPNANVDRVKQDLAEHEIYLEGYGGSVPFMPISAKTGTGVPELLDLVLLAAELEELKGNPDVPATGVVIEAHVDPRKGMSATLIVKDGRLRSGMVVAAGRSTSPVRIMENFLGKPIREAIFSSPVFLAGFSTLPQVGTVFQAYATKKEAEAAARDTRTEASQALPEAPESGEKEIEKITIPLLIKTDVAGSIDAVRHEVNKLSTDRAVIKVIGTGAGAISENDVRLAGSDGTALILGFNVKVEPRARELSERLGITVETFDIIYKLTEWLSDYVKEKTPKQSIEERQGLAKIIKTFSRTKDRQVVGGEVTEGVLSVGAEVRILRRNAEIGRGKVVGLRQQKAVARSVTSGNQFGLQVESRIEVAPGDHIESFVTVTQ